MFVSWKISLTANVHMIIHKDVRYLVTKFTHNTYLVVSPFLWREFCLRTLTKWNHPINPWHNFILVYLMKLVSMIALMQHIFLLFFNFSYKRNDSSILDNHVVSHVWLRKSVSLCIRYLSTIISCFVILYYYWHSSRSTCICKICRWWSEW